MAEQPIKGTDIIESGIFTSYIKEAEIVIQKEELLIKINKELLTTYRDIASVTVTDSKSLQVFSENTVKASQSIEALNDSELNLINTKKAKVQLEQEEAKLRKILSAEQAKAKKELALLNSEYKQASKELSNLKYKLKDLAIAGKTNTKEYKDLNNQFKILDKNIRQADASVGDFQRNVGNYSSSLKSIGGAISGAFSVGALVSFGKKIIETRAEFQKYEAVLTNALGSNSLAVKSLENISEIASKTPFSVSELTESYVKLVNRGFKPTSEEIIKLGDLAASQGKSFDQLTEAILDAQSGEFERLKEFGIRAKTVGDNVTLAFKGNEVTVNKFNEGALRNAILGFGELEGVTGGMVAISDTLGGKISNLGDNFDTFFNNLGKSSQGILGGILDDLNNVLAFSNKAQNEINTINRIFDKAGVRNKNTDFTQNPLNPQFFGRDFDDSKLKSYLQFLNNISNNTKDAKERTKTFSTELNLLKTKLDNGSISSVEYRDKLLLLSEAINNDREATKAENEIKEKNVTVTKKQTEATKKLTEQKKKEAQPTEELALKKQEGQKVNDDEFLKSIEKQNEDLNKIGELQTANIEAELEKRKKRREKELNDVIDNSNKIIDAVAKAEAEKSRLRQEELDNQISEEDKNIERQRQLADKGLKNELAQSEKRKTDLQLAKEEEKQAEIKRQKVLAFFKLFSAYAEKDPNTALQNALKDTILAESIAGAFFTGTEKVEDDLKGNKVHSGRDGYRIAVDGSERIMTGEQNKLVGGLSNEELASLASDYNNGLLDTAKYAVIQKDFASNVKDSVMLMQMANLNKQVDSLTNVIKNRPVSNFEFDGYGDFIKTTIENGFTKRTTYKQDKPRI